MLSMTTLAMATPSMSKRARSAPKIRSALSTLAPPVKWQFAGDDFDELKICVRSRREDGRVPPPSRDDNAEGADESSALECAAAGCSPDEHHVPLHRRCVPLGRCAGQRERGAG